MCYSDSLLIKNEKKETSKSCFPSTKDKMEEQSLARTLFSIIHAKKLTPNKYILYSLQDQLLALHFLAFLSKVQLCKLKKNTLTDR